MIRMIIAAACVTAFTAQPIAGHLNTSAGETAAPGVATRHVLSVAQPLLVPEDGLLLGNGDLSVSVYQSRDQIRWRFGKGDVWDRRIDTSDDPKPPHIQEIAHGIAEEGWKCPPYGESEAVALKGTKNPERMRELCKGAPASYNKRPYPCPKPVGELALQLPPDLPSLRIRQDLSIEQGCLRITAHADNGVELRATCFVPPDDNVLVVRWELLNWTDQTRMGNGPPLRFALYRWADPDYRQFGQRFFAESGHGAFLLSDKDAAKVKPLPPPTVRQLTGRPVIEQTFPPDPTFPQGFRYLMAPFVSRGEIHAIPMGAVREARLHIAAENSGWLVVAVPSSSDGKGPEAETARFARALSDPAQLTRWTDETKAAAARFWSHSAVRIGDPLLENLWYETFHARRCTTKAGKPPPGLFLPSTVRDFSHWHGDYHTNYNLQQPFWADFTANQLEVGDAYFTAIQYFLQMGRIIARKYYGTRGAFIQLSGYPIVATDDVLGAVPMGRMAFMTGWAVTPHWQRYLLTKNNKWLAEVGYPAIRECALFYTDFMQKRGDGLYHIFPSNQGEDGFTGDAKDYTDRAQVMQYAHYCLRTAILASEVLRVDADLRQQWRDRLDHAAGDDGKPLVRLTGIAKHFREANPPEFGLGRPYQPAARSTSTTPWPNVEADRWYAGQYPLFAVPSIRSGNLNPEGVYLGMKRIIQRWRHPNGLIWAMSIANYGHAGAWTETLGICAPLEEMMLESFGGVLRIFPCWPSEVAASFRDFRAEGAFLVSARWDHGAVQGVELLSEKGSTCRLYSPWAESPVLTTSDGKAVEVSKPIGGIYEFATKAGQRYQIQRRPGSKRGLSPSAHQLTQNLQQARMRGEP